MFNFKKYIKEEISKLGIELAQVDIVRPPKEEMEIMHYLVLI